MRASMGVCARIHVHIYGTCVSAHMYVQIYVYCASVVCDTYVMGSVFCCLRTVFIVHSVCLWSSMHVFILFHTLDIQLCNT